MSTDTPQPTEWLAIAFLVEASLSLSRDWKRLYRDYIGQLLQRCTIFPNPNKPVRVAFVTYGTADTRPSPIVKKIFFTETQHIIQDIKDGSGRLGIGLTGSGCGKGMAALEGFAAILDMFDQLRNLAPKDLRVVHIAASPPDNSQHPCWNQLPLLDSLTWELLPVELKKRNIQLSGINTSSDLTRFTELYTQAAAGNPTAPWFNVEKLHYLFINGFTAAPRKAKRVAEAVVPDCAPEPKRARVVPQQTPADTSAPDTSVQASLPVPSIQPSTSTSPAALPSGTNVSQTSSQSVPQTGQQPNQNIPLMARQCMARMQAISVKRKQLEDEMRLILGQRNAILPQGNTEQLNFLNAEIVKGRDNYQKLTQILVVLQQHFRRLNSQSQGAANAQRQDDSQPSEPNSSAPLAQADTSPSVLPVKDPQTPFNPATTPRQPATVQSPIVNPHVVRSKTSGVPTLSPNLNAPNIPVSPMVTNPLSGASGLNAQMQKLLQVDRSRLPVGVTSSTGLPVTSTESTVPAADLTSQPIQQQLQPSNSNQIVSVLVWEGILSFNGTEPDGSKKEVHTRVSASSSNASNSHSKTWPASMTLRPAQTPAVSMPDFQDWIRRTKPVLCTFKAEAPEDEAAYSTLVSVMSAKSIYATASWQLQSGAIKENALIFPINNIGLCGAFFPLTGIPEMPQASPVAPTPGYPIPQQISSIIAQLPPEQRAVVINQLRLNLATSPEATANFFRVLLRQQQQQQNRAAMAHQFGLNPNLVQSGSMAGATGSGPNTMSMMGMNMNAMNAMGSMGNVRSMIPNVHRTGGGPTTAMNVNYDVLQSFMQRNNSDGNSGSGMGPN